VLDTDILVAAFRSNSGASRRLLKAALERKFAMLLSVPLMLEYEAVLTRGEQLSVHGATAEEVGDVLDELAAIGCRVTLVTRTRPFLTDAADEMVLETALNGEADAIVTFNERHFKHVAERLQISVIRPGDAVKLLRDDYPMEF
jgi:putative PIN family toxin of toxin-antitoxin system